jgi:hypothetical protein
MSTITVYTFEDSAGEDTFTTQNPTEAKDRGQRYGMRVIANEYEYSDSEVVWDFTEDDSEDTLGPAVRAAKDAAYGDSNDDEIELLQNALDEALSALGRQDLRSYSGHDPMMDDDEGPVVQHEDGTVTRTGAEHMSGPDGTCTDECVATHPSHADTRGAES